MSLQLQGTWQDLGGGNSTITSAGLFDPSIGQGTYQVEYTTPETCLPRTRMKYQ